jgi:BatD DUF11 like domain
MVKRLCFLLWMTLAAGTAVATEIDVQVEPNPPPSGESFRIAFTAHGDVDKEPDFSSLEPLVEILGRNRQASLQSINGNHTRTTTWVLEVIAKQDGPLVIPAIAFGKATSAPLTVQIASSTQAPTDDNGLFLEVDATPRDPYVQQQVVYTIRLWRRFELSNATLSEPSLSRDAIVRPMGEDRHLSMEKNGKAYEVIERRFAVFPQASGAVTIAPSTVTAQVLTRGFSLFDIFGQSVKTRRVTSQPIALNVRSIPATFPAAATWLPATKVRINEEWEPANLTANVGEPLTRTLTLWAEGLTSGQLPNFASAVPAHVKSYPDQPRLKDDLQGGTLTAVHQEKIALIPSEPGAIALPPVSVPWWNTTTDQLEVAELPPQTLTAVAAAGEVPATPQAPPTATTSAQLVAPAATQPLDITPPTAPHFTQWRGWFWVAVCSVLGWLATTCWLIQHPAKRARQLTPVAISETVSQRAARTEVLAACRRHDAAAARRGLLAWFKTRAPENAMTSLQEVLTHVPAPLASAIQELERALYQQQAPAWDGTNLARAFVEARDESSQRAAGDSLPPLFKFARE